MFAKFRQRFVLVAMVAMLALLIAGCGSSSTPPKEDKTAAPESKFINIATGGTAGVYYPLGGAIADILNKNIAGVNATAETTGASTANVNLLNDGSVQLAFIQNDISYYAHNGSEMFQDQKVEGLKCLATLYPETIQIVTLERTGIKSIADMKGKRVAVGASGSGTEANARQILAACGITYDDIGVRYLSFAEAATSLKDGNIEAAFVTAGFPTAAIMDIASQHKVVLLPIEDQVAEALIKEYPFYTKVTIPANTYSNYDVEIDTVAVKAMLVVTDSLTEQEVYDMTKAIFSNLDKIKDTHPVGEYITKEAAQDGISIPMHPGAEKYFKEN